MLSRLTKEPVYEIALLWLKKPSCQMDIEQAPKNLGPN